MAQASTTRAANRNKRTAEILAQLDSLSELVRVDLNVVFAAHGISPATGWRRIRSGLIPTPSKDGSKNFLTVGALRRSLTSKEAA